MRRRTLFMSAVFLASVALSIANGGNQTDDSVRITKIYSVGELPVWSKDGNFEPAILMALLRQSLGPDSWNWTNGEFERLVSDDGKSSAVAVVANKGIVVSASRLHHSQVASLLEQLHRSK